MLIQMDERYHNLIYVTKSKSITRHLRYCPICAADDRKAHGETYWHRSHQLFGVNICPVHGCELMNSAVEISSKTSPYLYSAEEMVPPAAETVQKSNSLERRIAEYVYAVFHSPMDMETDIPVGRFLHSKIEYTKYVSPRGEQRNMALLFEDFIARFGSVSNNTLNAQWKLQKMFSSDRLSMHEVCLVALFLGVTADELVKMTLPEKSQPEWFDERVRMLHAQGMKYPAIAEKMNAPYDVVKAIGEGRY